MPLLPVEPHRFRLYKALLVERFTAGAGKVLEIGCGLRWYESHCRGAEYVGLDMDPTLRPNVLAHAESLPFHDSCFDVIIMLDVLEHVADAEAALRECVRVLKSGGKLVITTPNTLGFGIYDSYADRTHLHHFSWSSLERMLRENGLRVEKRIPLHLHIFWPLRLLSSPKLIKLQQSICVVARR